jgi:hypothetical protein
VGKRLKDSRGTYSSIFGPFGSGARIGEKMTIGYWLMDGRALNDIDSALVLETCDTLEEAQESIYDYGDDTCIVQVEYRDYRDGTRIAEPESQKIVDSLLWRRANEKSD